MHKKHAQDFSTQFLMTSFLKSHTKVNENLSVLSETEKLVTRCYIFLQEWMLTIIVVMKENLTG